MVVSISSRLKVVKRIAAYHVEVLYKTLIARLSRLGPSCAAPATRPGVTILITNINNRYPLELTLHTLVRCTRYANYHLVVADNGSTDGSIELVEELIEKGWPIRLIKHGLPRPQHEWYDLMSYEADTPYWVGIHEDMMFIGEHWLEDLIDCMETHPGISLLGGEYFPTRLGFTEPVLHEKVDLLESLSTWIFCARTSLREHIDTSFAFYKYYDEGRGRTVCYDQGGKLIADMRASGLGFACMPAAYQKKYQHIANISWAFKHAMREDVRAFKQHQLADVRRRARTLRKTNPFSPRTPGSGGPLHRKEAAPHPIRTT